MPSDITVSLLRVKFTTFLLQKIANSVIRVNKAALSSGGCAVLLFRGRFTEY